MKSHFKPILLVEGPPRSTSRSSAPLAKYTRKRRHPLITRDIIGKMKLKSQMVLHIATALITILPQDLFHTPPYSSPSPLDHIENSKPRFPSHSLYVESRNYTSHPQNQDSPSNEEVFLSTANSRAETHW